MDYCGPPPGGGFLILTPTQMRDQELVDVLKFAYPQTKLIQSQKIPYIEEMAK